MGKGYSIQDNIIFGINEDGSVSKLAIIDGRMGYIKPINGRLWYQDLEKENRILEHELIKLRHESHHRMSQLKKELDVSLDKVNSLQKEIKDISNENSNLVNNIAILSKEKRYMPNVKVDLLPLESSIKNLRYTFARKITFYAICIIILLSGVAGLSAYYGLTINKYFKEYIPQVLAFRNDTTMTIIPGPIANGGKQDSFVYVDISKVPLIIKDVLISNKYSGGIIETEYGEKIKEENTMYLAPKIKYYGINPGTRTLRVRWIKPDGSLSTGSSSIGNFSQVNGYNISSGKNDELTLDSWGNEEKGHWKAGQYFIEIWSDNVCLIRKPFTIY